MISMEIVPLFNFEHYRLLGFLSAISNQ